MAQMTRPGGFAPPDPLSPSLAGAPSPRSAPAGRAGRAAAMLRRWRKDDGAQLVEFALVLPLLLLVVLGIAEFGIIFQRYEVLTNAAREGARIAVLPGYATADVQTRVTAYVTAGRVPTAAGNPNVAVADVSIPVGGGLPNINGKRVTVTYTHTYLFLGPIGAWFGAAYVSLPLTAVSEMRTETIAGT